ncbi:MAG: hypothetical protein M3O50_12405 [Myxococcota bacterium]|nr:hypothetical protein [Myxococcota bacterium]
MTVREEETGLSAVRVLDAEEIQGVLSGSFYAPEPPGVRARKPEPLAKPSHYKVICISLYTRDLERLDALVEELKTRGMTKASRSALIRCALDQIDLDKVPRGL